MGPVPLRRGGEAMAKLTGDWAPKRAGTSSEPLGDHTWAVKWEWEEGGPAPWGALIAGEIPGPHPTAKHSPQSHGPHVPSSISSSISPISPRPGQTEGSCHAFIPEHLWTVCSMPTGRRGPGDMGTCVTQPPPQVNSQAWKNED
ncbi:hypothetical protein H1C71_021527, partial [Ictidomys tridecemlineatus]